jgi:hypothetical protein
MSFSGLLSKGVSYVSTIFFFFWVCLLKSWWSWGPWSALAQECVPAGHEYICVCVCVVPPHPRLCLSAGC